MTDDAHIPRVEGIENLVLVGRGGFASVYRGHQIAFRRDVAVKVIQRTGLDGVDRQRFERECQAMGAVSDHPGIVTLYDAGFTADERPYMVMAFVSGGTLHDRLASSGPMSWRDVTRLGVQLSGALETAHRAGVLHRDIKPANVLHAEYGDKLSDFGIARIQGGHETRSGIVTASVNHVAPEILDGRPPTARADVYGLASTLYEALAGRAAFDRDDDEGLLPKMHRVMTEPPADLRAHDVPDELAAVIERAMAKDPAARYATAEEFGSALRGAQSALGLPQTDLVIVGAATAGAIGGPPPSTPPPPPPPVAAPTTPAPAIPPSAGPDPASTAIMGATAGAADAGGSSVAATTVVPATPPGAPPPTTGPSTTDWEDSDSGGPMKAVLIFGALAAIIAIVIGIIVLTSDDGGGGGPTAPTIPPPSTIAPGTTLSPDTTLAPATTVAPDTTVAPTTTTAVEAAQQQLQQLLATDAATVDTLAERWVPQLSAKRDGLVVEGVTFGPEEILADHNERRNAHGAVLVDGATYNFRIDNGQMVGWFITIVPIGYDTADEALQWCLDANIDRGNCFARFISTTVTSGTTKFNP